MYRKPTIDISSPRIFAFTLIVFLAFFSFQQVKLQAGLTRDFSIQIRGSDKITCKVIMDSKTVVDSRVGDNLLLPNLSANIICNYE